MAAAGAAALAGGTAAQATAAPHWQIVYRTTSTTAGGLDSVTAPSKTDAWAAGASNGQPVILNWNGKSWKSVQVPGTAGFQPVQSTAADANWTGDVWLFGSVANSSVGQAHVWNGKSWRTIALPTSGFGESAVVSAADVWGYPISSNGCYTVPGRTACLYHWTGAKWTETKVAGMYRRT